MDSYQIRDERTKPNCSLLVSTWRIGFGEIYKKQPRSLNQIEGKSILMPRVG